MQAGDSLDKVILKKCHFLREITIKIEMKKQDLILFIWNSKAHIIAQIGGRIKTQILLHMGVKYSRRKRNGPSLSAEHAGKKQKSPDRNNFISWRA